MAKQVMISIKKENLPEWEKFTSKTSNVSAEIVKLVRIYQLAGFPKIGSLDNFRKFINLYQAWQEGTEKEMITNDKPDEMVENGRDYNILYELKDLHLEVIND